MPGHDDEQREDFEELVRRFLSGDVGTPPPPQAPTVEVARGGRRAHVVTPASRFCVAP